jgi:hypothetical protein
MPELVTIVLLSIFSVVDITPVVAPPSFDRTFCSKEGIFKRVLERYMRSQLSYAEKALNQPASRGLAEQTLLPLADLIRTRVSALADSWI